MAIITVRYKDIPWQEMTKHITPSEKYSQALWDDIRGKEVRVETPPLNEAPDGARCTGPFYGLVDKDGRAVEEAACIHYLEIGD